MIILLLLMNLWIERLNSVWIHFNELMVRALRRVYDDYTSTFNEIMVR